MKQKEFIGLIQKFLKYGMSGDLIVRTLKKNRSSKKLGHYMEKKLEETGDFAESLLKTAQLCSGKKNLYKRYGPLLKASEETGNMEEGLNCILRYLDDSSQNRTSLFSSLAYPGFMIMLTFFLSLILYLGAGNILEQAGIDLLEIKKGIVSASVITAIGCLGFLCAGLWAFEKEKYESEFFSHLRNFTKGKVDLEKSLKLTAEISKENKKKILGILSEVKDGKSFFEACKKSNSFDDVCESWLFYGEETGNSEETFHILSCYFNQRRLERKNTFIKITEPFTTGLAGIYIFILMVKIALPVLSGLMPEI